MGQQCLALKGKGEGYDVFRQCVIYYQVKTRARSALFIILVRDQVLLTEDSHNRKAGFGYQVAIPNTV